MTVYGPIQSFTGDQILVFSTDRNHGRKFMGQVKQGTIPHITGYNPINFVREWMATLPS